MNKKRTLDLTPFVVIAVLLLIILSLVITLINNSIKIFPSWAVETFSSGIFTLLGAALGATLAGKYASETVKKHFEYVGEQEVKSKIENDRSALSVTAQVISGLSLELTLIATRFERRGDELSIKDIKKEISRLIDPIKRVERVAFEPQFLLNVSSTNLKAIYTSIRLHIDLLKYIIKRIEDLDELPSTDYSEAIAANLRVLAGLFSMVQEKIDESLKGN